jgi:hypothetical protein
MNYLPFNSYKPGQREHHSVIDDVCIENISNGIRCRFYCLDCGFNTRINNIDYYIVHNYIWDAVVKDDYNELCELRGYNGMLCINCLELRLGRKLVFEDFTRCMLNHNNPYVQSLRKAVH